MTHSVKDIKSLKKHTHGHSLNIQIDGGVFIVNVMCVYMWGRIFTQLHKGVYPVTIPHKFSWHTYKSVE